MFAPFRLTGPEPILPYRGLVPGLLRDTIRLGAIRFDEGLTRTGTYLLGPPWLSRTLLVVASAGLDVVGVRLSDAGHPLAAAILAARGLRDRAVEPRPGPVPAARLADLAALADHGHDAPGLWSMVFPLGMYSVATLAFGRAAGISFMEPLARVMIWVAVAAWVLVAAAFLRRRAAGVPDDQ